MEFLEVFRRFIWIFFRVETEWGKWISTTIISRRGHADIMAVRANRGPPPVEILLADYNGRLDDD